MYNNYEGLSGFDLSRTDDLSTLWEELDLKGLVDANSRNVNIIAEQAKRKRAQAKWQPQKSGYVPLNEVISSPAFETLTRRYHTTPKPPLFCTPAFIEKLADPISGRHKNVELVQSNHNKSAYVHSPPKKYAVDLSSSFRFKTKKNSSAPSFFLTGEEEYDNNSEASFEHRRSQEIKPLLKQAQKKSFRCKVQEKPQPPIGLPRTKNTKTNASLFRDKYLAAPAPGKSKKKAAKTKGWKSTAEQSGNIKRVVKSKYLAAEWTLRPEQPKPRVPLPKPVLPSRLQSNNPIITPVKTKTNIPDRVSRKLDQGKQSINPSEARASAAAGPTTDSDLLRSKSSADVRRRQGSLSKDDIIKPMATQKKPSSTSNIFDKANPRNSISKLSKPVLSPIKSVKPKEPDVSDVIEANYKKMKRQFGLVSRPISASGKAKIDQDITAAIKKAEALTSGGTLRATGNSGGSAPVVNNSLQLLNQYAKKLSTQFSIIDESKAKYRALADDLE